MSTIDPLQPVDLTALPGSPSGGGRKRWRLMIRIPPLKVTVPLILLGFAATLSAVNVLYHAPAAERAAEEDSRKRLVQELSRLQSTLEYLLLKGDVVVAQHEIAVLAHNHDVVLAALTDDEQTIIAATRRAWLGQKIDDVLPQFDLDPVRRAVRDRRAGVTTDPSDGAMLGYAGVLIGSDRDEIRLRPTRTGSLFLEYDLKQYKAEARAQVLQQSVYWAGWVTALALAMWLVFHFLLTRRTAQLVHAAEQLAAGNVAARSGLTGGDELGRLSRAFDAMALEVAETQTRLRRDIAERARVQRALENSEARLQQILNNATAVVSVKDTEGRFLFVNRQWEEIFRIPHEQVVGRTDSEMLPHGAAHAHRTNDLLVLQRNSPMEFEETARLDDGLHTYISIKFPLHDAKGVAYAVCGISTDITERKRANEALRASEASYRAIFDASEDAIFVHEIGTGAIVDVNPRACETFGYTREEFRRLEIGTLGTGQAPFTQQDAMALMTRAAAGEQLRVEWLGRSRDGALRWHEVFIKRAAIGGEDRILALARDINGRKIAEAALRASEEQYHAMFNASIDGLALWNGKGQVVDTNPALWRMYGYTDAEASAFMPGSATGPCYSRELLRAVAAGQSLHLELTDRRKDGTPLELDVHGIPMHYQGQPHVLTIARDITDKKRSAEELARQRETLHQREKLAALGSLLAGVAHELNNPLSVVVARAVLLEERGDSSTQAAAAKIRTAAERCARIVRTFLAMARQQQPQRVPVAINDVIGAALDITGYAIRTSSIAVTLDLAPGIPPILADADQLHQVLLNLVINAQQSLQDQPAPRRIRVASRFERKAGVLRIAVADNGPGIPEHLRARIFEPYFTTKPTGIGLGVGLAVSLGIVEAHGGTLGVDCPAEGGAVFTVTLPVGAVDVPEADAEPAEEDSPDRRTILIVDDEADIRETLSDILTAARHRVVAVGSAREALERMAAEHYDLILTDIRMPDLDGRALYQAIEERWPGRAARVIFVTGDTLASALREFVSQSGRPVIEKPFLPSDVRRIVAEWVIDAEPARKDG
ncbi:MAG TPA: PAS domain S-box protein [Casimicrobiaceae bacterium]|nr:PAS domain S-box protein [Casimicrobiaceae bacterium]